MFFTDRDKATVTFDTSVKNITGYFTYNRFTNRNGLSEKALSVITANANKTTTNKRFKKIFITTRESISVKKVAEVLETVLSTLRVTRAPDVVDL